MNVNGITHRIEMSSSDVRFPGQAASDDGFSQKSTSLKNSIRESAAQSNFPRHASAPVKKAYARKVNMVNKAHARKVNRENQRGSSLLKLTKALFFMTLCNTVPFFNGLNTGYKLDANRGRYEPFNPDLFQNRQPSVNATNQSFDLGPKFRAYTQLEIHTNHSGEVFMDVDSIATPAFVYSDLVVEMGASIELESEIPVSAGGSTLHTSLFTFGGKIEEENIPSFNASDIFCPSNVTARKDLLEDKEWKEITSNTIANASLEVCELQSKELKVEEDDDYQVILPYVEPPAPEFDSLTYGIGLATHMTEFISIVASMYTGVGLFNQHR